MGKNLAVETTIMGIRLLSKHQLKQFWKEYFRTASDEEIEIVKEVLSADDPRYLRWIRSRLEKDLSIKPIAVAKQAAKYFGLPRVMEPVLYKYARRYKRTLLQRRYRANNEK